ncbi:MAG: septal ring lytic transglycosylase RlpA family protein, partial [Dermabacter sp.]|nr:septal ring lytic transglycosylase RlpA family protein [Dermabacter sp.]
MRRTLVKKKTPIIAAAALATVFAGGGGGAAYAMSNEVTVNAYGRVATFRTFDTQVADILEAHGVDVSHTDLVKPALGETVDSGDKIVVKEREEVKLSVDGKEQSVLVEGGTVADALSQAGIDAKGAAVSPKPDTKLEDVDGPVTVTTPKDITVTGMNGSWVAKGTTVRTVQDLLDKYFADSVDADDDVTPSRDTVLKDGDTIHLVRLNSEEKTEKVAIDYKTETRKDDAIYEGETRVVTKGEKGEKTIVKKVSTTDGKVSGEEVVKEEVTKAPVTAVIAKGTKKRPAEEPKSEDVSTDSGNDSEPSRKKNDSKPSRKKSSESAPQGGKAVSGVRSCGASFYGNGDGTDGGPTASGERFNTHAYTAAHKSLPFGTRVRVTNKANGRSVVVRINDRGPYVGGRCLDLSYAAMKSIGGVSSGVARVDWQIVE